MVSPLLAKFVALCAVGGRPFLNKGAGSVEGAWRLPPLFSGAVVVAAAQQGDLLLKIIHFEYLSQDFLHVSLDCPKSGVASRSRWGAPELG